MRQRAMTAVQRRPQTVHDIIPLSLDEVEVSIVPASSLALSCVSRRSSSIVPFRRLLADPETPDEELRLSVTRVESGPDGSSCSSTSLAIVPRDNTMLGVVMSSAVRRRDDEVPLPSVRGTHARVHTRTCMVA